MPPSRSVPLSMTSPFRTLRRVLAGGTVTELSPESEAALRSVASVSFDAAGDAKARLFSAYERRGTAPASALRLLVREVRWAPAALSSIAAACVVVIGGALADGGAASGPVSAPGSSNPGVSASAGLASTLRRPNQPSSPLRAGERPLAFAGTTWERIHPLPRSLAKVRVVTDDNLSPIGVGFTPDLEGP